MKQIIFLVWLGLLPSLYGFASPTQRALRVFIDPTSLPGDLPKLGKTYALNALFLTDTAYLKPPLLVLSHGAPVNPTDRPTVLPEQMQKRAAEFVKLGFAVLILERRGYGKSSEEYAETPSGDCNHRDYRPSAIAAASDILGTVRFAKRNLMIDSDNIVLAGHSAGGFSSIFAGSYPEPGLKAVLNFSGGRGAKGNRVVCTEQAILDIYKIAGEKNRIPTLWLYSENDQLFSIEFIKAMLEAFKSGGGNTEFHLLPPFGMNGHALFSMDGVSIWQPLAKDFLMSYQLCPLCSQ